MNYKVLKDISLGPNGLKHAEDIVTDDELAFSDRDWLISQNAITPVLEAVTTVPEETAPTKAELLARAEELGIEGLTGRTTNANISAAIAEAESEAAQAQSSEPSRDDLLTLAAALGVEVSETDSDEDIKTKLAQAQEG